MQKFASHPVLRVEVFFEEPVGRELEFSRRGESGVSCCLHTIPWATQKSTSMTVGDIHRQVGADTHTMLPLPETRLPGMAHLLTSYAGLVETADVGRWWIGCLRSYHWPIRAGIRI